MLLAQVIARQLLVDQRPAAQQLLREVLLTEPAVQPPGQWTTPEINLPLLQDLLQLALQPNDITQAGSGHTSMQAQAAASESKATTDSEGEVPNLQVNLLMLCEQLGMAPAAVAQQLSTSKAEGVRMLLAQQAVRAFLKSWRRFVRAFKRLWVSVHGCRSSGSSSTACASCRARHAPVVLGVLAWFMHAGLPGARLAGQLLVCMLIVAATHIYCMGKQLAACSRC